MKNKEAIFQVEEKLLQALKSSNLQIMDELIHDDLLFVIPTGETITKEMDLSAYREDVMKVNEILVKEQSIKLFEDTAVVSVIVNLQGKYLENKIDGDFRYLRIWKLLEGKWKVIAGSSTPV